MDKPTLAGMADVAAELAAEQQAPAITEQAPILLGFDLASEPDQTAYYVPDAFMEAARSEQAPAGKVPSGWKLMPEKLTQEMADVLTEMLTNCHSVEESYSDLLSAAPAAPDAKGQKSNV